MTEITLKAELRDLIHKKESLSQYDYTKIRNMDFLFEDEYELKEVPFLDITKVRSMFGMFKNCRSLKRIPHLDTINLQDMGYMFSGCISLEYIPELDISGIDSVKYLHPFGRMFKDCSALLDIGNIYQYPPEEIQASKSPFLRDKYPEYFI
jgi:hypothetical protein